MNLITDKLANMKIVSDKIIYSNSKGYDIVAYHDYLDNHKAISKNFVIIPPAYGETKKDYISLSYYLVVNGFDVIRYDATNHAGESYGDVVNFTMSNMEDDLSATIDYATSQFGISTVRIVSTSLSSRVAVKLASKDERIRFLVCLVGVVNVQATLKAVYREDMITDYKNGKRWGVTDILGFEVSDHFIDDAIKNNYNDFDSTIEDMRKISCDMVYIRADKDVWVDLNDVIILAHKFKSMKLVHIKNAMHRIEENPRIAQQVIKNIVESCLASIKEGLKSRKEAIKIPSITFIVRENKKEMEIYKKLFPITKQTEKEFWSKYLSKYTILFKSKDYQNMVLFIMQLFGRINLGDRILDAGCGDGHFGSWLLLYFNNLKAKYQIAASSGKDIRLVNLDFVESALDECKRMHTEILKSSRHEKKINIEMNYLRADLTKKVPLPDESFDKICCNLVLSYLEEPQNVMINMVSKLKKGGKIVVSSLKPQNDLSEIYRDFTAQDIGNGEIDAARKLLTEAGKIRYKEKHGHYIFFMEEELKSLFEKSGLTNIKVYRTFGNQANIAVGDKK